MTLTSTLAAMARPMSLILEDKALLPEPLLAVALYDFEGETEMAELTFAKGQMLVSHTTLQVLESSMLISAVLQRVFCEDFGASWSLAMLVDAQGNEVPIDESDGARPRLTRGLVAQGFYEVSRISALHHYELTRPAASTCLSLVRTATIQARIHVTIYMKTLLLLLPKQ